MPQRAGIGLIAALLLAFAPSPTQADEAVFAGRIGLSRSAVPVGMSGLELSPDGVSFTAIGDDGWFLTGRISRQDGAPVALLPDGPAIRMRGVDAAPGQSDRRDAEGLAIAPGGDVFVSFENVHQVRRWRAPDALDAPAGWMPDLIDVPLLEPNAGIEALALGPDNALYALPERLRLAAGIPVYRLALPPAGASAEDWRAYRHAGHAWERAFFLPARGRFQPVGADFGPDGQLYVLERAFVLPVGFRSRVRRFALAGGRAAEEAVLLETPVGRHGNLEGLAVWRDADGAIRLTMLADDNDLALQRKELVEYRVVSAPGDG